MTTPRAQHGLDAYRRGRCRCPICRAANTARVARNRRGIPDLPTAQQISLAAVPWPGPWALTGACRTRDPAEFFPVRGDDTRAAKACCRTCPVLIECRTYGLDYPSLKGIWGGLSERQRRRIRRATRLDLIDREAG